MGAAQSIGTRVGPKHRDLCSGKKGGKKKIVDPFSKKVWYDVKAPSLCKNCQIGKTVVSRTVGTKIAADGLKGRVFECNQADLHGDESGYRKMSLIIEDIQGKQCLTNFHGMSLTRDKLCSMVKKWKTLIEAFVDVSITDGYRVQLFCIGFTHKRNNQLKKSAYAQHSQVRSIRAKMVQIMTREVEICVLWSISSYRTQLPKILKKHVKEFILYMMFTYEK